MTGTSRPEPLLSAVYFRINAMLFAPWCAIRRDSMAQSLGNRRAPA